MRWEHLKMKETLLKVWDHLEEFFLIPSLIISTGLIFFQVIMRYIFRNSLSWSEEVVRYLYVWQTWVGVSYAARNGSHLRITMLKDRLPEKAQKVLEVFVVIVWVGFAVFVMIQGLSAVHAIASFGQKSSALRIPMQICYMSIPVGMVLMSVRLIERTIKYLRKSEGGSAE